MLALPFVNFCHTAFYPNQEIIYGFLSKGLFCKFVKKIVRRSHSIRNGYLVKSSKCARYLPHLGPAGAGNRYRYYSSSHIGVIGFWFYQAFLFNSVFRLKNSCLPIAWSIYQNIYFQIEQQYQHIFPLHGQNPLPSRTNSL